MATDPVRDRLYAAYASTHAGTSDGRAEAIWFAADVRPHLPGDRTASIVDLGCGQGHLVKAMLDAGYVNAEGIDISPEQVRLAHRAGIQSVRLGDFREGLRDRKYDAVTATDFFEHLTRQEALEAADAAFAALRPDGVLILRVPNLASPFGGRYRFGDLTHETSYTDSSLRQLGAAAGFDDISVHPCPPVAHGTKSAARLAVWKVVSGAMKLALAAETGQARGHLVTQNVVAVMRKRSVLGSRRGG